MTNLSAAIVAFRAECPDVGFDSTNPHFKSKYASLKAINDAINPLLAKHKLAVLQFPVGDASTAGCITRIIHESGEMMEEEFRVPIGKSDAQKACAAVSYARRFGLSGALGIVTTEDVDGNDSVGDPPGLMTVESKNKAKVIAQSRSKQLDGEGHVIAWNEIIIAVAKDLNYDSPADMQESDFPALVARIEKWEP